MPSANVLSRVFLRKPFSNFVDRGETNAMPYLRDRFADDGFRCLLFGRSKRSIDLYAKDYEERFVNIAQSLPSERRCGW
jgi:hypothetical protein